MGGLLEGFPVTSLLNLMVKMGIKSADHLHMSEQHGRKSGYISGFVYRMNKHGQ